MCVVVYRSVESMSKHINTHVCQMSTTGILVIFFFCFLICILNFYHEQCVLHVESMHPGYDQEIILSCQKCVNETHKYHPYYSYFFLLIFNFSLRFYNLTLECTVLCRHRVKVQ